MGMAGVPDRKRQLRLIKNSHCCDCDCVTQVNHASAA